MKSIQDSKHANYVPISLFCILQKTKKKTKTQNQGTLNTRNRIAEGKVISTISE